MRFQKWDFEKKKLSNQSLKIFFALITKENSSKDVSVTYFQNMPILSKLLLH